MRRSGKTSLLAVMAVLALGGAASAGSIDLTDITPGGGSTYGPSDTVSIEVTLDSAGVTIIGYFFHVDWSPGLSLVDVGLWGPYPYPDGGWNWGTLNGNLSVDAYGLYLLAFAAGGKSRPGTFTDTYITTLIFHVEGQGPWEVWPHFAKGDVIGDTNFDYIEDQFTLNGVTLVPEPAAGAILLLGSGLLAVGYAARRR